jgi:undecaprenyl-diphosphatase
MRIVQSIRRARHEPLILTVVLLLVAAIWSFAELADEVLEQETHAFDEAVLLAMRSPGEPADPWGPGWIEEMGRDFTALGGVAVLTFISLAAVGYLLLQGKRRIALMVVLSIGGGILLSTTVKYGFDRPRPDLVPHESLVYTASFPSGHSMMAAVVYLTLGVLLARAQPQRRLKVYLIGLAVLVMLLVGVSRVYLGVHWPTDVLAGWTVGTAWALMIWLIALWLQQRGEIERED